MRPAILHDLLRIIQGQECGEPILDVRGWAWWFPCGLTLDSRVRWGEYIAYMAGRVHDRHHLEGHRPSDGRWSFWQQDIGSDIELHCCKEP